MFIELDFSELKKIKNFFSLNFLKKIRWLLIIIFAALLIISTIIAYEIKTSRIQSEIFSRINKKLYYAKVKERGDMYQYPSTEGPYDNRLGYSRIPSFLKLLQNQNYILEMQIKLSDYYKKLNKLKIFTQYYEKTQTGISITDDTGELIYSHLDPIRVYDSFDSIPVCVVKMLMFIEDRNILDFSKPYKNPAVEWDRFAKATFYLILKKTGLYGEKIMGGSTLATQLEKYRHSPEGITGSPADKLKQMFSASIRAYKNGKNTSERRKQIVLDYINSVPMAAVPGYGEINGLGDGLWAWYNTNFDTANLILNSLDLKNDSLPDTSQILLFKQVLSLFIAHRRPTYFLLSNRKYLNELTNAHLRLLVTENLISKKFSDAAQTLELPFRDKSPQPPRKDFLQFKAANTIRAELLNLLNIRNLYELDRFDLRVKSTLHKKSQENVTAFLKKLNNPELLQAKDIGDLQTLYNGDPKSIIYSFTLYERTDSGNILRVQTDNFDQPFDINKGVKLDLGSTAKLRTLITYLDVIAELHNKYSNIQKSELRKIQTAPVDFLSRWALDYLMYSNDTALKTMLNAAMSRQYSANPDEKFFTGGGLHTFGNFSEEDNTRIMSVREAMYRSTNLVFVRLMRDIVRYYSYNISGSTAQTLENNIEEKRKMYLSKFADHEGKLFMSRFYKKFEKINPEEIMQKLLETSKLTARRFAAVYRIFEPTADIETFKTALENYFPSIKLTPKSLTAIFESMALDKINLSDRGFIARIHPLELWLAAYMKNHPDASYKEIIEKSAGERQEVYSWLFKTKHKNSQDIRIRSLMEVEAFLEIHKQWKKMGYPFDALVPSFATALGSSADRPAALAEMMGIIVNNGIHQPTYRIKELHFAENTPYEVLLTKKIEKSERVIPQEVAEVIKETLIGVVDNGTGRRVKGAYKNSEGKVIPVGGKTGTGDHRFENFDSAGNLISSKVMNRTATFTFLIGDKYYGTVVAFVPGRQAENYKFTSALPAHILKILAPYLESLIK